MKRSFDITAAAIGLIVISPLLLVIALIVKLGSKGPVVYCQQRIGRDFQPFMIYKFRTMRPGSDADGNTCTIKGDSRITPIGRFLRKTKLDEMPQLFNVLFGDMSLVGPRPEVAQYVEMFREDYKTVLSVRPGITDYAAIEYSNEEEILQLLCGGTTERLDGEAAGQLGDGELSSQAAQAPGGRYASAHEAYVAIILPAKVALYKKYIAEQSFLKDLKILIRTLGKIAS